MPLSLKSSLNIVQVILDTKMMLQLQLIKNVPFKCWYLNANIISQAKFYDFIKHVVVTSQILPCVPFWFVVGIGIRYILDIWRHWTQNGVSCELPRDNTALWHEKGHRGRWKIIFSALKCHWIAKIAQLYLDLLWVLLSSNWGQLQP